MLDQIVVPDAFMLSLVNQGANCFELMVARKDQRLFLDLPALIVKLLLDLQMDEPGKQVEQAGIIRPVLAKRQQPDSVPAPPSHPLLKGRKWVAEPASRVVIKRCPCPPRSAQAYAA